MPALSVTAFIPSRRFALFPLPSPFTSLTTLEQPFIDGLTTMLDRHRSFGVYILVLANAAFDPRIWARLAPALAARHAELASAITDTLRNGGKPSDPEEDMAVFLKLLAIGFPNLATMESRSAGPWSVMFNPIRALRPPRNSGVKFESLLSPFDRAGFHFNRPFLDREIVWEGELAGRPVRMLYNKFPFARLHGLLVPDALRETPQFLSPELHIWAWDICAESGVPGLCLGYNSYGAGASVNHLHFQSFVQPVPLPVQDSFFAHNGGTRPYPVRCLRFSDAADAWAELDRLHHSNTPYNLIYSKGCLHLVARVAQDSDQLRPPYSSFGWSEMAGAVTLFSRQAYERFTAAEFEAELARFEQRNDAGC